MQLFAVKYRRSALTTFTKNWVNLDISACPVKSGTWHRICRLPKFWKMLVVGSWTKWVLQRYFTVGIIFAPFRLFHEFCIFLWNRSLRGAVTSVWASVAIRHWVNCYTGWLRSQLVPYRGGATARGWGMRQLHLGISEGHLLQACLFDWEQESLITSVSWLTCNSAPIKVYSLDKKNKTVGWGGT